MCEDYKKFNGNKLSKHVLWDYLYILQTKKVPEKKTDPDNFV